MMDDVHANKPPMEILTAEEAFEKALEDDPLREHFVWWDGITADDVDSFEAFLDSDPGERAIHRYLEDHPVLLVQPFRGGHGRYVLSRTWLGRDREIDFMVGARSSAGLEWVAVELEGSATPLYNNDGPTRRLRRAMQQIDDWRIWLEKNLGYAERPPDDQGLGLENVGTRPSGLILMGRRKLLRPADNSRRREVQRGSDIEIHTYDWLIAEARGRVSALRRWKEAHGG